jgi:hypothetical protein
MTRATICLALAGLSACAARADGGAPPRTPTAAPLAAANVPPAPVAPVPSSPWPDGVVIAHFGGKPFDVRAALLFPEHPHAGAQRTELEIFNQPVTCEAGRRVIESRTEPGESAFRIRVGITIETIEWRVVTTGVFSEGPAFKIIREGEVIVRDGADAAHARVSVSVVSEDGSSRLSGELVALRCP